MAQAGFKQDMPPPGGYQAIDFKRVPGQQYFTTRGIFLYLGSLTLTSWIAYKYVQARNRHKIIERSDRDIAMQPFLTAERDRAYLKYLRKCRAEEKEIMKDVPNWTPGTFYGMPVYRTLPEDYHLDPNVNEFFAHTSEYDTDHIWNFGWHYLHG